LQFSNRQLQVSIRDYGCSKFDFLALKFLQNGGFSAASFVSWKKMFTQVFGQDKNLGEGQMPPAITPLLLRSLFQPLMVAFQ